MCVESIIRYCAPTLAGLKVGSLYSYRFSSFHQLWEQLQARNSTLNPKGIFVRIFRITGNQALIYIYRKSQLQRVLAQANIQAFLAGKGYDTFSLEGCFTILQRHLRHSEFPHEIGIFLGYPLDDIQGFIANKGKHFKHCGCWKVYGDEETALKTFQKYKKCTDVYCLKYQEGFDITRLTVAV